MQTQQERNSKTILYAIIAILLIFNLGLFYLWQSGNSKNEALEKDKTVLNGSIKEKEALIAAADAMIAHYKADSTAMVSANKKISGELARKSSEIALLTMQLRKEKNNGKLVEELKAKLAIMGDRLAQLERENVELKDANNKLTSQNQDLNNENTKLSLEGKRLKNLAARLKTSDLSVETLKKQWITGKEVATNKAKEVESIRISYKLDENNLAEAGERTVFVKVTGPEGVTYSDGDGGIADLSEGKSTKFTYKTNVVFEKEAKAIAPTVWKPKSKLAKGKYSIELYTEGYLMGSAVITLK